MKKEESILGSSIESVDLAALLISLDFPLNEASVIEGKNLDSAGHDPKKTMSWKFCNTSTDGRYTIDKVKEGWKLPKKFTLDVLQLSRLLAHNMAVLKNVAKRPQGLIYSDFGGIGILADEKKSDVAKDIPLNNIGFGGCSDTAANALAITLGCIPVAMYKRGNNLSMLFDYREGKVNIDDIKKMINDDRMRDENNKNAIAVLICQLDNRQEILANIDKFRKKIRLIADGGETQVLYDPNSLSSRDRERIERHFE